MTEKHWTKEQSQAINARGGTLLVSAAAGSGKTAVLVERVITLVTGKKPVDADRLLVVTFTNAAAAEMKERISLRLGALIAEDPLDRNLQRQQILLQNAHISTIHSFCLNIIREHFESLNIPPDFRIADENEVTVMRHEALAELLEEKYAHELALEEKGAFLTLAGMLGSGRDDSMLEDTILRLYDFICSLPDPEGWLDDKLRMYDPALRLCESPWGRSALNYIITVLSGAKATLNAALNTINQYDKLADCYAQAFTSDLKQIDRAIDAAKRADWDAVYKIISDFNFDRLGSPRKFEQTQIKEEVKSRRDGVKELISKLRNGLLCCDEAGFKSDIKAVYPLAESLFAAVIDLDERFFAKKQTKNMLDFSDLERLALKLLIENTEGEHKLTAAARAISQRFEEVLVDEYQDTNPTQDAIFNAVSNEGRRLFMVGDVKQSIYRFRKATPELFIDKQEHFKHFDGGEFPAKIILGSNFRSRSGVTGAVNFIFSQLMSKSFGEIEYGSEEALIPAAEFKKHECADFALHIVDTSGYDDNDGKEAIEARHIADVINKLVEEKYEVMGENGPRPVKWRDFIILLRSVSGRAEKYKRELTASGIPVYADVAGGYIGSYEVAVMLSLLRILDNPLQDVPLLSVMMSPMFGFTPDDLAHIRIDNRRGSLYLALSAYSKEYGGRYAAFIDLLDGLRRLAAVLPADRLILRIFDQTGFLSICEAMPAGEARRANLRLLLEYARSYEKAGYKGLAGFLRFIDRISEHDGDLAPASAVSENADVVRIMSIHKSKGLESPICIVAGCANRFNREDLQRPAMFHPVYGFGSIVRDEKLNCRYTTLAREVVKMETEKSSLSEEMRVLYVAMTRAKEKLICVLTLPNPDATFKKAAGFISGSALKLDPISASSAMSFAEWLLACALRHPDCAPLRRIAGVDDAVLLGSDSRWELNIAQAQGAPENNKPQETAAYDGKDTDPALLDEIKKRVTFAYPFKKLSQVPSKVAVSALAEKGHENDYAFTSCRPAFLSAERLTPAQKGTALHEFMHYASLSEISSETDIEAEIARLVKQRYLLPEQGAAIDRRKVDVFIGSDIYARIMSAKRVFKEFRFNIEVGTEESAGYASDEKVVLQGMADVVFEDESGLYILDYKTDNAAADELRLRYSKQLDIYARAVSQVFKCEIKAKYIYGFKEEKLIII
jgi:ATP-dependent helicase/nuclease subunit A